MAPKRRQRCRDEEAVLEALIPFMLPDNLLYRETVSSGRLDATKISVHEKMLLKLRAGPCAEGNLNQKLAYNVMLRLVRLREPEWFLGAQEHESWARSRALRLRAMMRDVDQAVIKARSRPATVAAPWLQPFLGGMAPSTTVSAANPPADPANYIFGWNDELQALGSAMNLFVHIDL